MGSSVGQDQGEESLVGGILRGPLGNCRLPLHSPQMKRNMLPFKTI